MNTVEIIFSPTGGTEKVAHIISGCWGGEVEQIDLSDAKADFSKCSIDSADMVLIAKIGRASCRERVYQWV